MDLKFSFLVGFGFIFITVFSIDMIVTNHATEEYKIKLLNLDSNLGFTSSSIMVLAFIFLSRWEDKA